MERDLLVAYKTAHDAVAACDDALKSARAEERSAEQALIDYLDAHHASATGKYDGLGWAQMNSPRLFASVAAEHLTTLFACVQATSSRTS